MFFPSGTIFTAIVALLICPATATSQDSVSVDRLARFTPADMRAAPHFATSVIDRNTGTIYVSGQMALGPGGEIIGKGDLLAQMRAVYAGINNVLESAGTSRANILHQRVFIVGMDEQTLPVIREAMVEFYGDGPKAASTTVGIETLLFPDALVEIDVTAAISPGS